MAIVNPPGWIQALSTHTAAQMRMYHTMLQAGNFSSANTIRARGGVHPNLGQEFVVTQAGSPNMTVLVETGYASVPGTESATQGNYLACNDAQVTLSIAAAHATLPRIDIVVVNIRDAQYSGANNDAQLQVITGTPASSPVAPAAPSNAVIIAQVAVAAAAASITNGNITDTRYYMAAAGGVISARSEATRPVAAEIAEGQLVYTKDNDKLWLYNGTTYLALMPEDKGVAAFAVTAGADTRANTSYGNLAGTGSQTSFSFTKVAASTRICVSIHATFFSNAANTGAAFGVLINGTDYDIARLPPTLAANEHVQVSGVAYLPGIAAGAHTVQGRWKTITGGGTISRDGVDWLAISARETLT